MDADEPLVHTHQACPLCGERRVEQLVWLDATAVQCQMCFTEYELPPRQFEVGRKATMDRELVKLRAEVDQSRSELRRIVSEMDARELVQAIKTSARGDLGHFDERMQLLIGLLAAVQIFDIRESAQNREEE